MQINIGQYFLNFLYLNIFSKYFGLHGMYDAENLRVLLTTLES